MHRVSVVMPARNDGRALRAAVESCLQQDSESVLEIIIAVGPSTDDTKERAVELAGVHPAVIVIDNPTGQTPAGLNLAIQASRGDVVVRVDARSQLRSDYVANALDTMDQTGAANVTAIQHPVGRAGWQRVIAAAMNSRAGSGGAAYRSADRVQQVDTGYLGVFNRDALLAVGGYDETFVRNQDAELNLRLNRAGHEVWLDPRLVVDYGPRSSLSGLASQFWQYGWWRRVTSLKHRNSLGLRQLLPVGVVAVVVMASLLAVVQPIAIVVPVGYLVALLVVGLSRSGLPLHERIGVAAALATMHVCWASGFVASSVRALVGTRHR